MWKIECIFEVFGKSFWEKGTQRIPSSTAFPLRGKESRDALGSMAEGSSRKLLPLQSKKGHEQCIFFRHLFDKKLKASKILLREGGTTKFTKRHSWGIKVEERPLNDGLPLNSRCRVGNRGRAEQRSHCSIGTKHLNLEIFIIRWNSVMSSASPLKRPYVRILQPCWAQALRRKQI